MDFATQFTDNEDKIIKRVTEGPPTARAGAAVKTQWRNLGTCPGCKEMIHGGAVMEALGHKWHKDCFACQAEGCGKNALCVVNAVGSWMPASRSETANLYAASVLQPPSEPDMQANGTPRSLGLLALQHLLHGL